MKVWSRNYSLRRRLMTLLFAATCVYWSVVAAITLQQNISEVHELYDIHLSHAALALLRLTEPADDASDHDPAETVMQLYQQWPDLPQSITPGRPLAPVPERNTSVSRILADKDIVKKNIQHGLHMRYQLWRNGVLVFRSANAPHTPITDELGFSVSKDERGNLWRNYSIHDTSQPLLAMVSELEDDRIALVRSVPIFYIDPVLLGMPLFILLVWFTVQRGLGPLIDLGQAIARRKTDSLMPIDAAKCPHELKPIVVALNSLIEQMKLSLEAERRFNSNAAHELNTPLAAVQAHLYAARQTKNETDREIALNHAQIATSRGIRLIHQMLAFARLGPHRMQNEFAPVDLTEIAQNVCAELVPLAMQRNQTLEVKTDADNLPILGQADLVHQLIGNLVDNAMRHSPAHSRIEVELTDRGESTRVGVTDNGPGIPAQQRERVFNRFIRLSDESAGGTGLGLAICRKIAELHHAEITLTSGPNDVGLCVCVDFPKVQPTLTV